MSIKYDKLFKRIDSLLEYIDSLPVFGEKTTCPTEPDNKPVAKESPKKKKQKKQNSTEKMSASKKYNPNNVFAKIVRGEIPSYKIFETDKCNLLSFFFCFTCLFSLVEIWRKNKGALLFCTTMFLQTKQKL